MTKVDHRIVAVSFRLGVVDCTCGVTVVEADRDLELSKYAPARARPGTPEALAEASSAHRREAGEPVLGVSQTIGKRIGTATAVGQGGSW